MFYTLSVRNKTLKIKECEELVEYRRKAIQDKLDDKYYTTMGEDLDMLYRAMKDVEYHKKTLRHIKVNIVKNNFINITEKHAELYLDNLL